MKNPPRRPAAARQQGGVALIVALVMLVIIGVASVSIMRGALSSDLIANNTRTQTLAMQAAQIALRYCEVEVVKFSADPTTTELHVLLETDAANAWETFAHWGQDTMINKVPDSFLSSDDSTFTLETPPECMAQRSVLSGKKIFTVTARGFSPDYAVDEDGNTESGSVVWLQSTLRL